MKHAIDWLRILAVIIPATVVLPAATRGQDIRPAISSVPAKPSQAGAAPLSDRPTASLQSIGAPSPAVPLAAPNATQHGTLDGPVLHELSPWSMFLAADAIVKGVMVGLMLASIATWTVFAGKSVELAVARRGLSKALARFERAKSLPEAKIAAGVRSGFLPRLVVAATEELELSGFASAPSGIKERAQSRFADLIRAETQAMRRGMGLLATIGATAPFVGLFGTVWGIMNSFIGISKAQTTNLAVVAPGIAEALLATAIGLVAAIPAVIIYNHFSRATRSYQLLVNQAAGAAGRLLSRELDRDRPAKAARLAE
ncbi:MAG: tonB-system energizer ExbB [Beijerinckiaceae bacterium]|nr:tonB-system energizer ExbB [Beijerinckiaceae bacterium]